MNTSDFNFFLPEELIAQEPASKRDEARLLVMDKKTGDISHQHFYDIISYLEEGDVLVLNNSKVIPARLYGEKENSKGKCEFLLLSPLQNGNWECLVRPGRRLANGVKCIFGNGALTGTLIAHLEDGKREVSFDYTGTSFYEVLDKIGEMPLPHYITKKLQDNTDYQTVYSKERGSVAAPTAGLHFTQELLDKLTKKGVQIAEITLHVGLGTFRPVKEKVITNHIMHTEHYSIPEETAHTIQTAKRNGKKVVGVGTTSARTLESAFQTHQDIIACHGDTNIFIYPGYQFSVLDGLITNFHLPESTLIMLVSAFAGYSNTMHAYDVAIKEKYKFFSFGDAMLLL